MKYAIGTEFMQYQGTPCVIDSYDESKQVYLVREGDLIARYMWTEDNLDHVMDRQESIRNDIRQHAERIAQRQAEEQAKQDAYNNVHGFCDNMTNLQRGKVLATLNKTMKFDGRIMTRKDWVQLQLDSGYIPELKQAIHLNRRNAKNYYTLSQYDNWYEITKTEYEYACYINQ